MRGRVVNIVLLLVLIIGGKPLYNVGQNIGDNLAERKMLLNVKACEVKNEHTKEVEYKNRKRIRGELKDVYWLTSKGNIEDKIYTRLKGFIERNPDKTPTKIQIFEDKKDKRYKIEITYTDVNPNGKYKPLFNQRKAEKGDIACILDTKRGSFLVGFTTH